LWKQLILQSSAIKISKIKGLIKQKRSQWQCALGCWNKIRMYVFIYLSLLYLFSWMECDINQTNLNFWSTGTNEYAPVLSLLKPWQHGALQILYCTVLYFLYCIVLYCIPGQIPGTISHIFCLLGQCIRSYRLHLSPLSEKHTHTHTHTPV